MRKRKSKKTSKSYSFYNPLNLIKGINTFNNMKQGEQLTLSASEPLDPKDLTRTQQNSVIEHLKYSEALSNVEIADYLKLHRETIANRLKIINKESRQQLEDIGLSLWGVVYDLKRDVEFIKLKARNAGDYDLFLRASIAYINTCQKLGVIFEKPQELELKVLKHSEEDEKILIAHYRRIELGIPHPSGQDTEGEIVELIPDQPDELK